MKLNIDSATFNEDVEKEINDIFKKAAIKNARLIDINFVEALANLPLRKKKRIKKWIFKKLKKMKKMELEK